jgi:hypothetical protein
VDERWELAEFADEEAVGGLNLGFADGLRVDFDDEINTEEISRI